MHVGVGKRGIQDNLVNDSVRLLILYNMTAFCPFQRLAGQDRSPVLGSVGEEHSVGCGK